MRIGGVREKTPSRTVKVGDVLTISLYNRIRVMKVTGFAERRGDAPAARLLFADLEEPRSRESG